MSSDFERLLRQAREALPGPDEAATRRARERALAALRRKRRLGRRSALALAVAFLLAIGTGVVVGALVVPSGSAARAPVGLGFLPERGWNVLQSGAEATSGWPGQAIAANVPLSPKDEPDSLPYFTLLGLPRNGVVIVVTFTARGEQWADPLFPARRLPLRIRDAVPFSWWGAQVRPERPLGQYQLRAGVNGHNVDVNIYFGTAAPSPALSTAAQRQLDRLVVRPAAERAWVEERALPLRPAVKSGAAQSRVIDRTLRCSSIPGVEEVEARAHEGIREDGSTWKQLPFAALHSGGVVGSNARAYDNSLAWISAGRPSDTTVLERMGSWSFPPHEFGTVALNRRLCTPARARVPLSARGLGGGRPGPFGEEYDCSATRPVLVRLRAVFGSPVRLFQDRHFLKTRMPVKEAYLAVRTQAGKPLVFAAVFESGKARLFTAPRCVPD